ncbi:MAG: carboxy--processing protease, partial [Hyphomonadaceae bacterium]
MIQAPNNIREDNAQKPTKRGWLIAPVIAGSVCFGAILGGGAVAWSASHAELKIDGNREATLHQLDIFADVLARATIDYVVPPKQDKMIEAAINGMLSSLDPHSSFMSSN